MNTYEVATIIIGALGLISSAAAVVALSRDKKAREEKERERAMAEGQKENEFQQMKVELIATKQRVQELERENNDVGKILERINTVLDRLLCDVKDIGDKLDAYREEQLKGGCK